MLAGRELSEISDNHVSYRFTRYSGDLSGSRRFLPLGTLDIVRDQQIRIASEGGHYVWLDLLVVCSFEVASVTKNSCEVRITSKRSRLTRGQVLLSETSEEDFIQKVQQHSEINRVKSGFIEFGPLVVERANLPRQRPARSLHGDSDLPREQGAASFLVMDPLGFEAMAGYILVKAGLMNNYQRIGGAGDMGVDLVGENARGAKVVVQCKRYAPENKVTSGEVQSFLGVAHHVHSAERAIFVTSSVFTSGARKLASETSGFLVLFDGDELSIMLNQR